MMNGQCYNVAVGILQEKEDPAAETARDMFKARYGLTTSLKIKSRKIQQLRGSDQTCKTP